MINSSLLDIIRTFSSKEIKEFGEYISSPFFNKNEAVLRLYDYIRKQYPGFEKEKLDKEYVFSIIFASAEYNDGFMRNLMFNLNKFAEDFLKYNEFLNDDFTQDKYLLDSFDKRKLNKQFEKRMKLVYENLEKRTVVKNEHYFFRKYILENSFNRFDIKQMESLLKVQHARYGDLGNESDNLIKFFMLALLRRYREMLNKKYVYHIDYNLKFIDELVNHLEKHKYEDIPLIEFYSRFIQLMDKINERENYIYVKDFLLKNHGIFPRHESYGLLICLTNIIAVHRLPDQNRELFSIFDYILKNDLYSPDDSGRITFIEFVSILFVSLKVKEFEWAEKFVDKYKFKLAENERQNAANFSYARLNFEKGNFTKANEFLSKVNFEALYYKIWVKSLQIRIFYELGWLEEALSQIDSFRHFLKSNPLLTKEVAGHNKLFIKYTKKLISFRSYARENDIIDMKLELQKDEDINSKEWIIKKLNEIGKFK